MKTLDLIKSLKSSELVAKKDKQKATAINYKIILDYVLKYKLHYILGILYHILSCGYR